MEGFITAVGTLWITVSNLRELDSIKRVVVECGEWCRTYYESNDEERNENVTE